MGLQGQGLTQCGAGCCLGNFEDWSSLLKSPQCYTSSGPGREKPRTDLGLKVEKDLLHAGFRAWRADAAHIGRDLALAQAGAAPNIPCSAPLLHPQREMDDSIKTSPIWTSRVTIYTDKTDSVNTIL